MKYKQIKSAASTEATLWFLGWGFDSSIAPFIEGEGNVILLWDYSSLDLGLDLSAFSHVYVKAWSMGVWAAEACLSAHPEARVARAEAYCGTPCPADPDRGIGAAAIQLTIDHWDEANRLKFARKISMDADLASVVAQLLSSRSADDQRAELQAILSARVESAPRMWDVANVSKRDRIFPQSSQLAWWRGHALEVCECDIPHWPFRKSPLS